MFKTSLLGMISRQYHWLMDQSQRTDMDFCRDEQGQDQPKAVSTHP